MGTFAAVLAKSTIRTDKDRYRAKVSGDIEEVNGIPKIVRIKVEYDLKLAPDMRKQAQQAFESYLTGCPAAQSVIGCIDINHQLHMEDG